MLPSKALRDPGGEGPLPFFPPLHAFYGSFKVDPGVSFARAKRSHIRLQAEEGKAGKKGKDRLLHINFHLQVFGVTFSTSFFASSIATSSCSGEEKDSAYIL